MYSKGNPTSYNSYTYTWVNGRQLQSISNGTDTYSYKYDDSGIRTEKTVNGTITKYYLEGTKIMFEDRGNNNVIYYMYDNSGVSGFEYLGNKYYYEKNLQGDIIGILDDTFTLLVEYQYDSWGNPTSITDGNGNDVSNIANHIANLNPFRYRGYYWDSETGLYYLNSRYYNAEFGRFINADGIMGANQDILGYNLYAYCSNNPVNYSDPSGYAPKSALEMQLEQMLIQQRRDALLATAFKSNNNICYGTTTTVPSSSNSNVINATTKIGGNTYNYTINAITGDIAMDLSKNPKILSQTRVLAKEMLSVSNMNNRTVSGVSTELKGHYIGYWVTKPFGNTSVYRMFADTNIGTPGPRSTGMDWNANFWEGLGNPQYLITPILPIRIYTP